ncbi:phosphotransferase [Microbacterium protaetiae]|uniref:Phosphotransferase n=1 Tax=Microbacterium protaetiae TaxID=2509458 RepID=A0A4P6EFV5_9MICO|nr:phosphotransferase [Microbacterium protaetiae]QAY60736.1 phosphotransferase [Microbacterium protaetiae]
MARMPAAEIDVTGDLVARLLAAQHPDLADRPMVIGANGWDNVMVRLGDDLAVRVPRRAAAAALVEHEQLVLPRLARRLPVAVPVPVRVGRPTDFFPWSWSVVPWLAGEPAFRQPASARDGWAGDLADALVALHMPADADAPHNPVRGEPLAERADIVRARIDRADPTGRLRARYDADAAAPRHPGPPLWIHGDPHPFNMLADASGLRALIDFGDVTAGDPATDLATAWLTFTPHGRRAFVARYTERTGADAALWARARAWAARMTSSLLTASDDHAELAALGDFALGQVLGRR